VKSIRALGILTTILLLATGSGAQTWVEVNGPPNGSGGYVEVLTPLLLMDGTVMMQDANNRVNWWRLTPDINGSYVNGTWSQLASSPYGPGGFASAILPDRRVIVEGGENLDWTNQGAIFDPTANPPLGQWTSVNPPTGWSHIGDAESVVLANGTFMVADCCGSPPKAAQLNPTTLTWTPTGLGKYDSYDEEGWTLLPNGLVLTIDTSQNNPDYYELYNPLSGMWSHPGSTPVQLYGSGDGETGEMGPALLVGPYGVVFATGASIYSNGAYQPANTAVYDTNAGTWTAGPDLGYENGLALSAADMPGVVLPSGNVIFEVAG